jgi:hypothetical protein
VGKALPAEQYNIQVKVGLTLLKKKNWSVLAGTASFQKLSPLTLLPKIIDTLIAEANSIFSTNLATAVNFDRCLDSTLADRTSHDQSIILVGASHAGYLVTALASQGFTVHHVETKSWKPNTMMVAEAATVLELKLAKSKNLVVVVCACLVNAAYYVMTDNHRVDGTYHLDGVLIIAPSDMFTNSVKVCLPLLNCAKAAKKLVLSMPSYWLHRCCSDE